jgi:hypothetical protein
LDTLDRRYREEGMDVRIALLVVLGLALLFDPFGLVIGTVLAGPNGGGSIIVHTNDAYVWDSATGCTTTLGQPATCVDAVTRTDKAAGVVVWFLAAFVPTATPEVRTVYFGIDHDDLNLRIVSYGSCGSGLELPDDGWPSNTTGDSWGFYTPQTSHLFRFYWFVVSEVGQSATGEYFCSAVNPTGGYAEFDDNSWPPQADAITRFGCVHWYEEGSNTCPVPPSPGACCLIYAMCYIVDSQGTCDAFAGEYQGDGTICDPNPCVTGACCIAGDCLSCTEFACGGYGGIWDGAGQLCDPNPCPTISVDGETQSFSALSVRSVPNPTIGGISLEYQLPVATTVTLEIFNAGGSLVCRISEGEQAAGRHAVQWTSLNSSGRPLPSGVYLAKLTTSEGSTTARVVVAN